MALTNLERRNRDIYNFVTSKVNEKVHGRQKYTYGAVIAMAEQKFYLSQATIMDIVRTYEPPPEDPQQLTMLDQFTDHNQPSKSTPQ
jgi:hypothetical protein